MEKLPKTFIFPARENQFFQEHNFNNALVRRLAIAINRNSAYTGFYTGSPFFLQQFDLRQIRILRSGHPNVNFDAADKFRLYVATMKARNIQEDIPSISIDKFKDNYVLPVDFTSMQEATKNCHQPELVGKPPRLELNFTFSSRTRYWSHCFGRTNVFGCR